MKRYKSLFQESKEITEEAFWSIIKKYKDLKVSLEDDFCYITFRPLGGKGQITSMGKKDTLLGQEIKQMQMETKQLFDVLKKYDFEDIAIQGPQDNQIFIVDDVFFEFKKKK